VGGELRHVLKRDFLHKQRAVLKKSYRVANSNIIESLRLKFKFTHINTSDRIKKDLQEISSLIENVISTKQMLICGETRFQALTIYQRCRKKAKMIQSITHSFNN
jgi:hypothetical protein